MWFEDSNTTYENNLSDENNTSDESNKLTPILDEKINTINIFENFPEIEDTEDLTEFSKKISTFENKYEELLNKNINEFSYLNKSFIRDVGSAILSKINPLKNKIDDFNKENSWIVLIIFKSKILEKYEEIIQQDMKKYKKKTQ